jgi:hypothetical protein
MALLAANQSLDLSEPVEDYLELGEKPISTSGSVLSETKAHDRLEFALVHSRTRAMATRACGGRGDDHHARRIHGNARAHELPVDPVQPNATDLLL